MTKTPQKLSLTMQLVLAMVAGTGAGLLLGAKASVLGEIGLLVIKALKTLATPLVFFAILDSLVKTSLPKKKAAKLLCISAINAAVAASIAIGLAHLIPLPKLIPMNDLKDAILNGGGSSLFSNTHTGIADMLKAFVPGHILEPFTTNNVISVVVLALILGSCLPAMKTQWPQYNTAIENSIAACYQWLILALHKIVKAVPVAVFCVLAKVVGNSGFSVFKNLGLFVALILLGFFIHSVIYYSFLLRIFAKKNPLTFFAQTTEPVVSAFSTSSSIATLPITLRTLQQKQNVSEESSRLAACVGTNLNHDGILLYEAATALFVAQVLGIDLSIEQQFIVALTSTLAAVGIAGVPEAGLITLSLVLGSVNLPLAAVPVLLPVDWFLGRMRAVVNVISDMTVAHLLDGKALVPDARAATASKTMADKRSTKGSIGHSLKSYLKSSKVS